MSRQGKNLRLSYDSWTALRKLKFMDNAASYSTILEKLIAHHEGRKIDDDVRVQSKAPSDTGDTNSNDNDHSDKTIVVNEELHKALLSIKTEYMIEKGYPSRGPKAVSVSDILLELIREYSSRN